MKEALLHYVWASHRIPKKELFTTENEVLEIRNTGQHNHASGPDFFNARVSIDGQEWGGNVEIHRNASDWYAHGHEKDPNYDNVVLHVVWVDDVAIFRRDGSRIPTLELKRFVGSDLLSRYQRVFENQQVRFIPCERNLKAVPHDVVSIWQQRLYVARLLTKSEEIKTSMEATQNHWEAILFRSLMKGFGLNKNGGAFKALAEHLDFSLIKKLFHRPFSLETLLFGLAGFLENEKAHDPYFLKQVAHYRFLKNTYGIRPYLGPRPEFFGLRPANFPTIRLAQLVQLYALRSDLFQKVMRMNNLNDFYDLFRVSVSDYWKTHYTFGKLSAKRNKQVSKTTVHLLIGNTIVPLKLMYAQSRGNDISEEVIGLMRTLPREKNGILDQFETIGLSASNAFESQANLGLYHDYCSKGRCLQCSIGIHLLGRKR
ncbi:DUF2851 family protein [Flagellimonas sp. DF-77]|uniref:DUF2851 family protein n=1 Tax=Flagellimonas algarum TaxID=3230298 RepID=UPI0033936A87